MCVSVFLRSTSVYDIWERESNNTIRCELMVKKFASPHLSLSLGSLWIFIMLNRLIWINGSMICFWGAFGWLRVQCAIHIYSEMFNKYDMIRYDTMWNVRLNWSLAASVHFAYVALKKKVPKCAIANNVSNQIRTIEMKTELEKNDIENQPWTDKWSKNEIEMYIFNRPVSINLCESIRFFSSTWSKFINFVLYFKQKILINIFFLFFGFVCVSVSFLLIVVLSYSFILPWNCLKRYRARAQKCNLNSTSLRFISFEEYKKERSNWFEFFKCVGKFQNQFNKLTKSR